MKPEKTSEFGLPVTTKPSRQRKGLNLYGHFIQMAGYLRNGGSYPNRPSCFSFQAKVFIAGNKRGVVRGFEIQGGVNWIKKKNQQQLQHSRPGRWS